MSNIPVIRLQDIESVSKAMRSGKTFYIKDGDAKYKAVNNKSEELDQARKKLCALLQEAEDCKERCSVEECLAYLETI
ncbi:MAG: hypothetical protein LBS99_01180 [Clostridiales bacterium]|jgi:hypothetical protein|nr:hypothetical protein [Clostridiales bacterium]